MVRPTTVKTLPRIVGVAGGRDEERQIEGEQRRVDKENQSQNPPAGYHRGGRARQEAKTNTKEKGGTIHSPARGGGAKLKTHLKRENKKNLHHKGKKTKHTVLCYCVSSQLTLTAPRPGAEEGVGRTTKKRRTQKPYSPVPLFSDPITQTMAPY